MCIDMILSILVCVLSILVVVLMGWNIYSVIDTKNTIKNMDNKVNIVMKASDMQANQLLLSVYSTLAEYYRKNNEDVFEYFNYSLLALLHTNKYGDIGLCNSLIRAIIESFPANCPPITNFNKATLMSIIGNIKSDGKLTELDELKRLIYLMKSHDIQ